MAIFCFICGELHRQPDALNRNRIVIIVVVALCVTTFLIWPLGITVTISEVTSLLQNYYVLWKMPCFPYFPPLFIWITVPNPKCSVCVTNQPHSLYFLQAICVLFNEFHRYFAKFHWSSILQPQWYAPLMSSKSFDWIWQMMRIYFSTFCDIFYFDCVCFDAKTLACIKLRLESSAWNAPNHIEIYIEFNPKNNKRGSI